MLKNVTGFWVEDSGGETNNNVSPRGLRGGEGFRFISLMEDGLPITYDGIWGDFFLRPDLTHLFDPYSKNILLRETARRRLKILTICGLIKRFYNGKPEVS